MKIKTMSLFLLFALPFLGIAQHGLGVSSYYNLGNNYDETEEQMAWGLVASNQISTYFATETRVTGIFSKEFGNSSFGLPSTFEVGYLIRLRSIKNHNKVRVTLGTGFVYRYFFDNLATFTRSTAPLPNLNDVLGLPLTCSAEVDVNDHLTLSFAEENRFFPTPKGQFIVGDPIFLFYYGVGVGLNYTFLTRKQH